MHTELTRESAIALLRKYNKEDFHVLHGLTVGGVLKWYAGELGYDTLVAYADIRCIRDTWVDKNQVAEAQNRLLSIRNKTKKISTNRFRFVINDMITYTNLAQFRHNESRKLAERWLKMMTERDEAYRKLDILRKQYSEANEQDKTKLSEEIIPLEERYEILIIDITSLEKEIRAFEQR